MYLGDKDLADMRPGNPIGDSKTLETRGVGIAKTEMKDGKLKQDSHLKVGAVVYLNAEGKAVPFTKPEVDFAEVRRVPYGVAWTFNVKEDDYDLTPHTNEVTVVVEGVVPIKMLDGQNPPKKGDLVNPYGGALNADTQDTDGYTGRLTVLGVCDGVKGDLVAVRLAPSAANPYSALSIRGIRECVSKSYIPLNQWVYLTNDQPKPEDDDLRPRVAPMSEGGSNKRVYGLVKEVADPIAGEYKVQVLYYGLAYVPYIYETSPKLAALRTANGGTLPSTFSNRITYADGRVGFGLTAILTSLVIVGTGLDLGERIYRMFKGKSSPAKCVDDVPNGTPKFRTLLVAEGGKYDIEPDGYMGVFVNPGMVAPTTLTEAPVLLDPPELDANGNMLIHEGRIYAGSSGGGVTRITAANASASSFFGVSTPNYTDDEEVNPPTKNGEPRIRLIREGNANVVANGDWKQGDYIDYLGRAIPADEEEFVPHIGKALDKAVGGELGSVDIRPFNPNNYIVINHCNNSAKDIPLNTMVALRNMTLTAHPYFRTHIIDANNTPKPHPGPLFGVAGVLTRFDENFFDDPGEYNGRAIIQVSGYLKCRYDAQQQVVAGLTPSDNWTDDIIPPGGFVSYLYDGFIKAEPGLAKNHYIDIIGQLMIPGDPRPEDVVDAWLLINPRTVYYAGTTQSEDETEQ